MARPTKLGLDYFPHDTHSNDDAALALIEAEFGIVGYAVFFKLLEFVYMQGYAAPWGADERLLFYNKVGAIGVSESRASEIIKGLVRRSLFDERVLNSFRILTSRSIQMRWLEAKRKKIDDIDPKVCLVEPTAKVVSKQFIRISKNKQGGFCTGNPSEEGVFVPETIPEEGVFVPETPQSKVKESSYTVSPYVETVRPTGSRTQQPPDEEGGANFISAPNGGEEDSRRQDHAPDYDRAAFVRFFNAAMDEASASIPRLKNITPGSQRDVWIRARLREYGREAAAIAVQKAAASAFLNGDNPRGFLATADWIFRPNNFPKVLEGNYDGRPHPKTSITTHHGSDPRPSPQEGEQRQQQRWEYLKQQHERNTRDIDA